MMAASKTLCAVMDTAPSEQTPASVVTQMQLASNQRLIWWGQFLAPGKPLYEMPYLFTIQGNIDPDLFAAAFRQLVNESPVLRQIAPPPDAIVAPVLENCPTDCEVIAGPVAESSRRTWLLELLAERMRKPLVLEECLYDALLVRISDQLSYWFIRLHHSISDALNGAVLLSALSDCYQELTTGSRSPARPQFQDFVDEQIRQQSHAAFQEHQQWWADRQLERIPTQFYQPVQGVEGYEQLREVVTLDVSLSKRIDELITHAPFRQVTRGLSQFNVFATALTVWLHRLANLDQTCIGVTNHGRHSSAAREAIGLFMQLLPLPIEISSGETCATLAQRLSMATTELLRHAVPNVASAAMQHSFDVALNMINLNVGCFAGWPATLDWLHNGFGDPGRRLTVSVYQREVDQQYVMLLDGLCAAFSASDLTRAGEHLISILTELVSDPATPISSVRLLLPGEEEFIDDSGGQLIPVATDNVWVRFCEAAARNPSRVAVQDDQRTWTFSELVHYSQEIAREIDASACGPVVPLLCRRDASSVAGMLGILASGRCFMPVELDQPQMRRQELLQASGANTAWDTRAMALVAIVQNGAPHAIDDRLALGACYLLHTSGSTGQPNGVVVGHESLVTFLAEMERLAPLDGGPACWWTSVSFDVAVYEVFSAVLYGRTLHIPPDAVRNVASELFRWMNRQGITSAYLPPFYLSEFLDYVRHHPDYPLRRLLVGVEPIPQTRLAAIARCAPRLKIINGYGPTEATICTTLMPVSPDEDAPGPIAIGRPVSGHVLRIVDRYDQPVPPGAIGELIIAGCGLARGYFNRPELTANRFVHLPHLSVADRWYRTGDRVRLRSNGCFEFIGRIDDQIKLRGHRIELGEVAFHLRSLQGISDAVATIRETSSGRTLAGFFTSQTKLDVASLRQQLLNQIPRQLIPSELVQVESFPRTLSGKVDLKSLLSRHASVPVTEQPHSAPPENVLEFTLLSIWRSVLKSEHCGTQSNFYEVGGDSLDAMQIVLQLAALGVAISPADVFTFPTVSELAGELWRRGGSNAPGVQLGKSPQTHRIAAGEPALVPDRSPERVLTSGQKRLWYLNQLHPDSPAYHIQIRLAITGEFDPERARACVLRLVEVHAALRTNYVLKQGDLCAELRATDGVDYTFVDATDQAENMVGQTAEMSFQRDLRPFDLAQDSLVRLTVVRRSDNACSAALTLHHISVDQQSVNLLLEQFAALYRAAVHETLLNAVPFPEGVSVSAQSREFDWEMDRDFWGDYLKGAEHALELPADFPLWQPLSLRGNALEFEISEDLTDRLRNLAKRQQVSLHVLLLSAFHVLIYRLSAQRDITIGLPVSDRISRSANEAVGFFLQSLPLRSQLDPTEGFLDFVQRTHANFLTVLSHRSLPFEEIVRVAHPVGEAHRSPLFQTMFVLQHPLPVLQLPLAEVVPSVAHAGTSKFDLTMFVTDAAPRLRCALEYSTDLFSALTMERWRDQWLELLSSIAALDCSVERGNIDRTPATDWQGRVDSEAPLQFEMVRSSSCSSRLQSNWDPALARVDDSSIAMLNLLTKKEKNEYADWISNISMSSLPPGIGGIHELIAQQVQRNPGGRGVTDVQGTLSYEELNARADTVAAALQESGVAQGDFVGMLMDRSALMIVAILGILKRGAAYVPIDPMQPDARLHAILQDCSAAALITTTKYIDRGGQQVQQRINLDKLPASNAIRNSRNSVKPSVNPDDVAYVIYTSGSTGQPKGVAISHRSLVLSTLGRSEFYSSDPSSFLLLSSYAFDSSVAGIFWTLATGGNLVLPPPQQEQEVHELANTIARHRVSHMLCLPSLYGLLLEHAPVEQLQSLKTVIVAGETCPAKLVRLHFERLPRVELFNEYGPTEATVWSTVHQISPDDAQGSVPIGRPAPYTFACVLDEQFRPVPDGAWGELCLGGPKLTPGYLGQSELTSRAFVRNPFTPSGSPLLYRTGDRVRRRADGAYLYHGRMDNQLKVHGQRVEAEDIEAALSSVPGINEVVVGLARLMDQPCTSDVDSLVSTLSQLIPDVAEELLEGTEAQREKSPDSKSNSAGQPTVALTTNQVTVKFTLPDSQFIKTPRSGQQSWLLNQALHEAASDLQHLHRIAPHMVPGSEDRHVPQDIQSVRLSEQEIMEDWQYPLMQAMARYATESHGDVLEIGFGRGVSATLIQQCGVRSHTIIEANPHCIADHFYPWKARHPHQDIRLFADRWQNVVDQLSTYDGIFFHAFPLNEAEFVDYILHSVTFAEHFFPTAASLLRDGGVFTYLTTEIDSLSRRHQRSLLEHFQEVKFLVQPLQIPVDTRDAWWANSMIVLQARRLESRKSSTGGRHS